MSTEVYYQKQKQEYWNSFDSFKKKVIKIAIACILCSLMYYMGIMRVCIIRVKI